MLALSALSCTEPLDSLSVSLGAALGSLGGAGLVTGPAASDCLVGAGAAGAWLAKPRRRAWKSWFWPSMIWRAWLGVVFLASAASGATSSALARRRLTLPSVKADGLLLSMATSMCSTVTPSGARERAILPAVSPLRTRTRLRSASEVVGGLTAGAAMAAGLGAAGLAATAGAAGGVGAATAGVDATGAACTAGVAAGVLTGAVLTTGASAAGSAGAGALSCTLGGSNRMV